MWLGVILLWKRLNLLSHFLDLTVRTYGFIINRFYGLWKKYFFCLVLTVSLCCSLSNEWQNVFPIKRPLTLSGNRYCCHKYNFWNKSLMFYVKLLHIKALSNVPLLFGEMDLYFSSFCPYSLHLRPQFCIFKESTLE